jgi:DNA-binding MarR family transcriptional regulator
LGSLLTAAGHRLGGILDDALRDAGFVDLRAAHAPVFMALDPEGNRVTELAERTGMSKQAVGELLRYLQAHGYLSIEPDQKDGRAKRVKLTTEGWAAVDLGERIIAEFDARLQETFGPAKVSHLREILQRILETGSDDRRRPAPTESRTKRSALEKRA